MTSDAIACRGQPPAAAGGKTHKSRIGGIGAARDFLGTLGIYDLSFDTASYANRTSDAIAPMQATALESQQFAIVYQRSPGQSCRVVAHGICEAEAREMLKLLANDHRQVVAPPLSVTTLAGQTWQAVPVDQLRPVQTVK